LCDTNVFLSNSRKKRSESEEVTSVQGLGRVAHFLKAGGRKINRHTDPGYRYYTL